jgi:hypothetical protein
MVSDSIAFANRHASRAMGSNGPTGYLDVAIATSGLLVVELSIREGLRK